jgi:lambda family phage portal protein
MVTRLRHAWDALTGRTSAPPAIWRESGPTVHDTYALAIGNLISSFFDGDPFPGAFGPTKTPLYVDYWTLRERSKQVFTENPYAKGLIKRLVRNEIHTGLTLEAAPIADIIGLDEDAAQSWADSREIDWRLWSDIDYICDYREQNTLGELAAQCRMWSLIAGDVLVVLRINPKTSLPCVQLIDGGSVQTPLEKLNDKNVRHGVEIDARGRHVAYYVVDDDGKSTRIPAWGEKSGRRIAWLVYGSEMRLDDVRGEPLLACMLYMLRDLDRYRNSELRASLVNSMLAYFIKNTEGGVSSRVIDGGAVKRGTEEVEQSDGSTKKWNWGSMMPGTVLQDLPKGKEPVFPNMQRPNVNYAAFEEAILNVLAWVCEMPPEVMRLLFQNNFSASRQANNELNVYLAFRFWKFGKEFYQPIYVEHTIQSALLGNIDAPGLLDAWWREAGWRVFGAWCNAEWTGISRPSVDIKKDVGAATEMLRFGLTTQDQQCRKLSGLSFKTVLAKRKREIDAMKAAGISFESEENQNKEPVGQEPGGDDGDNVARMTNARLARIERVMMDLSDEITDRMAQ